MWNLISVCVIPRKFVLVLKKCHSYRLLINQFHCDTNVSWVCHMALRNIMEWMNKNDPWILYTYIRNLYVHIYHCYFFTCVGKTNFNCALTQSMTKTTGMNIVGHYIIAVSSGADSSHKTAKGATLLPRWIIFPAWALFSNNLSQGFCKRIPSQENWYDLQN